MHNSHAPTEARLFALHQGLNMKSQATIDLEIVMNAFISKNTNAYKRNQLDEIEVTIENRIYNLNEILENQSDFEQIKK
jgi:hypothetical protein